MYPRPIAVPIVDRSLNLVHTFISGIAWIAEYLDVYILFLRGIFSTNIGFLGSNDRWLRLEKIHSLLFTQGLFLQNY